MPSNVDIFDVMSMMSQGALENVYTTLPAKIVTYDPATRKAVVQPTIKRRDRDGDNSEEGLVPMALISGVQVMQPSTPEGIIAFPIKADFPVLLHFCSRSIDNYMYGNGVDLTDPQDYRVHQYSDCFATIGVSPFPEAIGSDPSDFVIRFNVGTAQESKVSMKPSGDVVVDTPTKFIVNAAQMVEVNTSVANITASDSVTIDTPQTTITGELRVEQGVSVGNDVETDAGFSANNHKHIGNLGKMTSTFI